MFADGSRRLIVTKARSIANAIGCILGGEGAEADANARLIAAAPELYAEADRARLALVIAAGFVERLEPEHATAMRRQAFELAKVLARARQGEGE
jgi:hypothetical protein